MYIRVHVTPGAKKERVTKTADAEFHIMVREPAERNMANKRIREIIAQESGISVTKVQILTGHRSQVKMMVVDV